MKINVIIWCSLWDTLLYDTLLWNFKTLSHPTSPFENPAPIRL